AALVFGEAGCGVRLELGPVPGHGRQAKGVARPFDDGLETVEMCSTEGLQPDVLALESDGGDRFHARGCATLASARSSTVRGGMTIDPQRRVREATLGDSARIERRLL